MKCLIVDDERAIRNSLGEILTDEGYEVDTAEDGVIALQMVEKDRYDVILCDIKMPNMDGIEVLAKLKEMGVDSSIVMISGHGDIETAVECIKGGAFDFVQKPLDLNRILITIKNASDKVNLTTQNKALKKKVYGADMIGDSAPMQHVRDMIAKVAPTDARVLITGPNGSGKELVARNLHQQSNRSAMPFIEVNCAAIPGELIESELFGHEKGSFTSAIKQHKGKFEQADGGTLFLDEIGDMSLAAQAKVLRVLQEKKFSRVGSDKGLGGVASLRASKEAMDAVRFAWENGKYTAAICAGPTVLADLGITGGRRATCYPGCEEQMGGAIMVSSAAVTDGKLITGTSAGCAVPFGLALVAA